MRIREVPISGQACSQHPESVAAYQCESCSKLLCNECIREGHALLLCRLCGERALPLGQSQPATTRDRRRHAAITKPYSFQEALFYPFRGMGLYLFIAALVSMIFVDILLQYGIGFWRFLFALGFWSLMIGLQFKIVRSTAEGDNELPDWPDYTDFGERVFDVLTYIGIILLQLGPAALYLWLGIGKVITPEPSLPFWAGFSVMAWLGAALATMAYGAAGKFDRGDAWRIDLHVRGFFTGGADAVAAANLAFGLGILFFGLRAGLSQIPIVGSIASSIVGAYWFFTSAHLPGVLFRRHHSDMERLYG